MEYIEPESVRTVAHIEGRMVLLSLDRQQLRQRGPGDLVTAEVVAVIPRPDFGE